MCFFGITPTQTAFSRSYLLTPRSILLKLEWCAHQSRCWWTWICSAKQCSEISRVMSLPSADSCTSSIKQKHDAALRAWVSDNAITRVVVYNHKTWVADETSTFTLNDATFNPHRTASTMAIALVNHEVIGCNQNQHSIAYCSAASECCEDFLNCWILFTPYVQVQLVDSHFKMLPDRFPKAAQDCQQCWEAVSGTTSTLYRTYV